LKKIDEIDFILSILYNKDKSGKYSCVAKDSGTGKCSLIKDGRFCRRHRKQYTLGIIDKNGNKLREPLHKRLDNRLDNRGKP